MENFTFSTACQITLPQKLLKVLYTTGHISKSSRIIQMFLPKFTRNVIVPCFVGVCHIYVRADHVCEEGWHLNQKMNTMLVWHTDSQQDLCDNP